ncbi:uncharacterized protein C4orf17 homolog [Candoia aspera]|uniref:uncharacterized protein C4orf17 homolog n=1 Tax=Candoia aspera TaxID=51853 RepID=UPI002FD7E325
MNINFRSQPEPQLNYKGTTRQKSSDPIQGTRTYFVCRHSPHPKTVCHIKGLNDAPICVVRDRAYNERHFITPGSEHSQPYGHVGTAADKTFPSNALPSLIPGQIKANVPHLTGNEFAELTKRAENTPLLKKRDDPLRKYLGDRPQSRTAQDLHLFPLHKPDIRGNINYTPHYLDQEIKVLEKLCDILQADTVADIRKWISKASVKEKEFVSNFIRSDMTSRDLLNYKQTPQIESEAPNIQALLRAQKGTPTECYRARFLSETERSNLLAKTEKINENVPLQDLPSSPAKPSSNPQSPLSTQTSTHLLYRKALSKRTQS